MTNTTVAKTAKQRAEEQITIPNYVPLININYS